MLKFNKGAVLPTALFFLLLLPPVFNSCKNSSKKDNNKGDAAAVAAQTDSSNLLVLDKLIRENPKSPDLFAKRAKFYADKKNY